MLWLSSLLWFCASEEFIVVWSSNIQIVSILFCFSVFYFALLRLISNYSLSAVGNRNSIWPVKTCFNSLEVFASYKLLLHCYIYHWFRIFLAGSRCFHRYILMMRLIRGVRKCIVTRKYGLHVLTLEVRRYKECINWMKEVQVRWEENAEVEKKSLE